MNKKQVIDELSVKLGGTPNSLAKEILDAVLEIFEQALLNTGSVSIQGFGKFSLAKRKGKVGYNMHTKEKVTVAPFTLPVFKAGKTLKRKVRERFN